MIEIGIDSFAAILPDPATGKPPSAADRIADVLDEVEVADRAGLVAFGIDEHHRAEFLDSAPAARFYLAPASAKSRSVTMSVIGSSGEGVEPSARWKALASSEMACTSKPHVPRISATCNSRNPASGTMARPMPSHW